MNRSHGYGHIQPFAPSRRSAFRVWCNAPDGAEQGGSVSWEAEPCTGKLRQDYAGQGDGRSMLCMATLNLLQTYREVNPIFSYPVPKKRCLTHPDTPKYNDNFDNENHDYILYRDDILEDRQRNERYQILDQLGTGTFGQVVKCANLRTGQLVAIKVIKNQSAYFNQAWLEVNMLKMLHKQNPGESTRHVVHLFSQFVFHNHLCLVFEVLSITLLQFLESNAFRGFRLSTVQVQVRQLLSALVALSEAEVIHCDLKPENILLIDDKGIDVKLIDLGSAAQSKHIIYHYVQSRFYRSPEVLLGEKKLTYKIDVWSLGCVAAELFLGIPIFPGQHELNMMGRIALMLGDFPNSFLERCSGASKYFNIARGGLHRIYTLKSKEQYEKENNLVLPEWRRFFDHDSLRDIIMEYPSLSKRPPECAFALRESFLDLLGGMLKIDPEERWSAHEAIAHPFLQGLPLPDGKSWAPPGRRRAKFAPRSLAESHHRRIFRSERIDESAGYTAPRFIGASSFGGFSNISDPIPDPFPEDASRSTAFLSTESPTVYAPPRTNSWSALPLARSTSRGNSDNTKDDHIISKDNGYPIPSGAHSSLRDSKDQRKMPGCQDSSDGLLRSDKQSSLVSDYVADADQEAGESAVEQLAASGARPPAGRTSRRRRRSSSSSQLLSMGKLSWAVACMPGQSQGPATSNAYQNQAMPTLVDGLERLRTEMARPLRPPSPLQTFSTVNATLTRSGDDRTQGRLSDASLGAIPRPPTPQSSVRMRTNLAGVHNKALSVPDRSQGNQ